MKNIFFVLSISIFINYHYLHSQTLDPFEIEIRNTTTEILYVRISPVGAIFNGDNSGGGIGRYSSIASHPNKGSEIIDTTLITEDFDSDPVSGDESLLAQARTSYGIKNFPDAIINYKGLVNNFPGSELVYTSLYEMYNNYSALDTSEDQTVTDVLFGDLKQYLESKITAEIYDNEFNGIAYDIILMCETRMKNLDAALTGYEFLVLYHPDAEQRMLASWDYEEIEEMLNGSGGGEKQLEIVNYKLQIEENEINRLDKQIAEDPLMKTLKENYDKKNTIEKNNHSDKVVEDKLISRAKENILKAKFLQKEEKSRDIWKI